MMDSPSSREKSFWSWMFRMILFMTSSTSCARSCIYSSSRRQHDPLVFADFVEDDELRVLQLLPDPPFDRAGSGRVVQDHDLRFEDLCALGTEFLFGEGEDLLQLLLGPGDGVASRSISASAASGLQSCLHLTLGTCLLYRYAGPTAMPGAAAMPLRMISSLSSGVCPSSRLVEAPFEQVGDCGGGILFVGTFEPQHSVEPCSAARVITPMMLLPLISLPSFRMKNSDWNRGRGLDECCRRAGVQSRPVLDGHFAFDHRSRSGRPVSRATPPANAALAGGRGPERCPDVQRRVLCWRARASRASETPVRR